MTAITGPRQCGKTTLVKHLLKKLDGESVYLDLERPSDIRKLEHAEWFLESQSDKLLVIDEIQRKPELFPVIRALVDNHRRPGRFLILGSASRDLIRQSSESLAGRISFKRLTPLLWSEIQKEYPIDVYMTRGGFPPSLLANGDDASFEWRLDFIQTFLERDLLQFKGFTPETMRRLWQMLAHANGQTINYTTISESLGVSHNTIRTYVDLLKGTFMVQVLSPYNKNTKKRLIKTPKVYVADSGLTVALLDLHSFEHIAGHPVFGSLWESVVLSQMEASFPRCEFSFYRTSGGAEIDLIIGKGQKEIAIECKANLAPRLSRGNYSVIDQVNPVATLVVIPSDDCYQIKENIWVCGLTQAIEKCGEILK